MAYKFPTQGGCWFCYMDDGEMYFSIEFDTWFHMDCLKKELEEGNPEAEIIATEHNIPFTTKFPEPEDYYPDDDDDDKEPYSWDLCDLEAIGNIHDQAGDE